MRPADFHPEARAELRHAVQFYERRVDGLGADLKARVQSTVEQIRDFPYAGAPAEPEARRVPLKRFPYTVVYRVEEEQIYILAVMHQRQKPGYWRTRT